jgi:hypothetical protein
MNRRQFCSSSTAALVCCVTTNAVAYSVASSNLSPLALNRVIYDSRFAQSRSFGEVNASAGYRTAGFRGDITALWFQDLGPAWVAGGGAVAGMTTASALFCLEQLAKDHWKRVVVRVDHPPASPGVRLVSWIIR